jgi:hypothetical protein
MHYLMVLLCMLNMGVHFQISVCKVIWMAYNNIKLVNLRSNLYCLKVIFLQRVFEALNNIFIYSKTMITNCTKVHFVYVVQMKEPREIFLMV